MRRAWLAMALSATLVGCTGNVVIVGPTPELSPGVGCGEYPGPGRVTFDDGQGNCLPSTSLESFQCDLNLPPVLVRGLGTQRERRDLGGDYRVAVKALPQGARLIGAQGGTKIYGLARDPSSLWVDDGSSLMRWLALPTRVPWAGRAPSVFFIGDSISAGAQPFIVSALPDWTTGFDAVVGRGSLSGIVPAQTQAATVPPPDVVVVELGTNDAAPDAFAQNAEQILTSLKDEPLVVWQTVHAPSDVVPQINRTIHSLAGAFPNTAIADWHAFATADILGSDGVHPLAEHEGAMADLIAPLLRGWREAVEGVGATSCIGK
jgi:lysophospholipase L1-like esterase